LNIKRNILLGLLILLFSVTAFSDQVSGGLDAGALQQQLQKENANTMSQDLPDAVKSKKIKPAPEVANQVKVIVQGVRFVGVKLEHEAELQIELKAYLGQSYSLQELDKFLDVVSQFYRKKGRVVQCALPPQTIKEDGIVTISVLEAKLGAVTVENPSAKARISSYQAKKYITAQIKSGENLDTDAIARGVVLLNEVPGIKAESALEAGKLSGETDVNLDLKQTSVAKGHFDMTNYGTRSTGVEQGIASININGPLKIGDQATAFGSFSYGAQYTQLGYSLPLGYKGLRLGVTGSYLNYENINEYRVNGSQGSAWIAGMNLSYPLLRNQSTNANVTAAYDHKSYLNTNLATALTNSEYLINDYSLGLSANHYDELFSGGTTSMTSNVVLGQLDLNGSPQSYGAWQDDNKVLHTYTPAIFEKIVGTLNHSRSLPLEAQLKINVSGQWAAQNLNSSEQFYLGGPYGVRAYPVAQAGGAQGVLGTVEIQRPLPKNLMASVFVDSGMVRQYVNTYPGWQGQTAASNTYSLTGAGLGLKWQYKGVTLSGIVAWKVGKNPLLSQTGLAVDNDSTNNSPRGWLNAGYGF
jgi:hemolysin activation/secretion protein